MVTKKFDIVISFEEATPYEKVAKYINKDAILSCKAKANEIVKELKNGGEEFRIVMPFFDFECIFASNKYHPTADLLLQNLICRKAYITIVRFILLVLCFHASAKRELLGICKN